MEEVWRLREPSGTRIHWCEIRNDSKAGAGFDVSLFENGELLYSKRCRTEQEARFSAKVMFDSTRNSGWVEDEKGGM